MRRIAMLTCPMVLAALLATTPCIAVGQGMGVSMRADVRPGTRIPIDQLGQFLASNVMIGETEKNLANPTARRTTAERAGSAALRIELISRGKGVIETFEAQAIPVQPGKTYGASAWITRPPMVTEKLAAPLKPAEFVIFRVGQWTVTREGQRTIPRQCEDASHAIVVTLVSDDARFSGPNGVGKTMGLCFDVGQ